MSSKEGQKPGAAASTQKKGTGGQNKMPSKPVAKGGYGKAGLITDNEGKISEVYDIDKKKLGEGSYGAVCKGKHKKNQHLYRAIKQISKSQMKNLDRFKQEIQIMKMMDHPNIIKLYETFEDARYIYLVMELCAGGELFDRIIESGHFTEVQAAMLMQQIIKAIHYMHENMICHRDLKPENFLFTTKEAIEKNILKIIDFGLSCQFQKDQNGKGSTSPMLTTKAGTPYYVAPQVLQGRYDEKSDLWSVGVIMYVMLCGYPPFFGETDAEVLAKVRLGNFNFNPADWKNISDDAKNLIRNLLKMNPKERYSADQALKHDWVKNKAPKAKPVSISAECVDRLSSFRSQNKLKKLALHHIALNLPDNEIKQLRELFQSIDSDNDGSLTVRELQEGIKNSGITISGDLATVMTNIQQSADVDGSGSIDYTEFIAAAMDRKKQFKESMVFQIFNNFDKDGDGEITVEELKTALAGANEEEQAIVKEVEAIIREVDTDGNGSINYDEFLTMMNDSANGGAGNGLINK